MEKSGWIIACLKWSGTQPEARELLPLATKLGQGGGGRRRKNGCVGADIGPNVINFVKKN